MTIPGVRTARLALLMTGFISAGASARSFEAEVAPLVETSCLRCHGERTVTPLDLTRLGFDLTDPETFRAWVKVYERVERGEMPPAAAPRPAPAVVETALGSLKQALVDTNLAARDGPRTPLRRLTRLEYGYTMQDLLQIDDAVGAALGRLLPAEADSGGFDTVAARQSMSPLHVRSYLDAADRALDAALRLGPRPETGRFTADYATSESLYYLSRMEQLGGGSVLQRDDGYATFTEVASTFHFHSLSEGFEVRDPGRYRVAVEAYPYNATTPVTLTVYTGRKPGAAASLDELIGTFDLVGDTPRTFELTPYLRPGDLVAPAATDLLAPPGDDPNIYFQPDKNVRDYDGEGIVIMSMTIEGPLVDTWPPESTRTLLTGVEFDEAGEVRLTKAPYDHIVDIVAAFAPRAFRRPLEEGELDAYASLARPRLADGRSFLEAVRVPLRAILSAPPFLYHAGAAGTADTLDDFGLATRLSYFLWRSLPDAALFDLAGEGRLSDPAVLAAEVDRMLDDVKSERFVADFAGQAFRLYELAATAPDPGLYPEYDDRLGQAMTRETELFLAALIAGNHGVAALIDADFTFVNRRLAEHYAIEGVEGQQMRKVPLAADSPRGGLLTQASVLKVTANGTTTSPVPRGNFVLTNLLGQPSPPPPPGTPGLEPDTRGATTIREQLDAHRRSPVCASCHRTIDPPGFALESFDPIGGFRERYRVSGGMMTANGFTFPAPYQKGLAVDPSGVTPAGDAFSGIDDYKRLLLADGVEPVARHLTSQLLVYGTGAEIEFADRDPVERIVAALADRGYPIRTMIHEVVRSGLFRSR